MHYQIIYSFSLIIFLLEIIYKIQVFTFVCDSTVLIFSTNKMVRKIMAKVVEIPHYIILKFPFLLLIYRIFFEAGWIMCVNIPTLLFGFLIVCKI